MLMRCLKKVFGAAVVLSAVLSLASIARAQAICNNASSDMYPNCPSPGGCKIPSGATIPCNVTVPSGATCTLDGVTVFGSIFVEPTGCLVVGNSKPTTVGGNINSNEAKCLSIGFNSGVAVAGDVNVNGTTAGTIDNEYDFVCNSSIGGSLNIESSGTGAFWCIGLETPPCYCAKGNVITGNLTFNDNQGGGIISDNTIGGNLTFNDNQGTGIISDNKVHGSLECSGNTPPPTGSGNTVGSSKCSSVGTP